MTTTGDEDAFDMGRVKSGDRAAFAAIVQRHERALFRFACAQVHDETRAEDAVQQTFLSLWRELSTENVGGSPRAIENLRAWLFATTRHALARQFRRRSGEPTQFDDVTTLALRAGFGSDDPETLSAEAEERAQLSRALTRLDDDDREIVWLRDVLGLTGDDAAVTLGLTVAAVKSRLHRARLRLMAEMRTVHTHDEVQDAG